MALGILTLNAGNLRGDLAAYSVKDHGSVFPQQLLWSHVDPQPSQAFLTLSSHLSRGLKYCGIPWDQVGGMAVSTGPGSFTGMRIGLAYCYGLARGQGSPLFAGLSSLQCAGTWLALQSGVAVTLVLPSTRTHGFWMAAEADGTLSQEATLVDLTRDDDPFRLSLRKTLQRGPGAGTLVYLGGPEHQPFQDRFLRLAALPEPIEIPSALCKEAATSESSSPPVPPRGLWSQASGLPPGGLVFLQPEILAESSLLGMAHAVVRDGPALFHGERPSPRFLRLSTAEEVRLKSPSLAREDSL